MFSCAVPIMSNEECRTKKYRPREITENMVCAGYDQGKIDACQVRFLLREMPAIGE